MSLAAGRSDRVVIASMARTAIRKPTLTIQVKAVGTAEKVPTLKIGDGPMVGDRPQQRIGASNVRQRPRSGLQNHRAIRAAICHQIGVHPHVDVAS